MQMRIGPSPATARIAGATIGAHPGRDGARLMFMHNAHLGPATRNVNGYPQNFGSPAP